MENTRKMLRYGEAYDMDIGFERRKGVYIGIIQEGNEGKIFAYYFKDFYLIKIRGRHLMINDVPFTKTEVNGLEADFAQEILKSKGIIQ